MKYSAAICAVIGALIITYLFGHLILLGGVTIVVFLLGVRFERHVVGPRRVRRIQGLGRRGLRP